MMNDNYLFYKIKTLLIHSFSKKIAFDLRYNNICFLDSCWCLKRPFLPSLIQISENESVIMQVSSDWNVGVIMCLRWCSCCMWHTLLTISWPCQSHRSILIRGPSITDSVHWENHDGGDQDDRLQRLLCRPDCWCGLSLLQARDQHRTWQEPAETSIKIHNSEEKHRSLWWWQER